jgi:flagellar basal body-associated protein FliL
VGLIAGVTVSIVVLIIVLVIGLALRRRLLTDRYSYSHSHEVTASVELTSAQTQPIVDVLTQMNPFTIDGLSVYAGVGLDSPDEAFMTASL